MKRTPLIRKTRLLSGPSKKLRTTPLAKVNPARKAKEFARTYGDADRVEWFKAQPCLICGVVPSENAHIPSKSGVGRKGAARWVAPLCGAHHRTGKDSLHALNKAGFEAAHHIDLEALAHIYDARWEVYRATHLPELERGNA